MKAFKTLFVLGVTCLQLLSGSQAQNATATTNASTTTALATTSTTASAATPTVYANTPGLTVSLFDQMAVVENTVLSMSISLSGQRTIGSIDLTVAKTDGSSNTTVVNVSGAFISTTQVWNVTSTQYPIGSYLVNIIVTPNNTVTATATTTAAAATTTAASSTSDPSVYYWRGVIRVTAPRTTTTSSGMGVKFDRINKGNGFVTMFIATGIVILGSLLAL